MGIKVVKNHKAVISVEEIRDLLIQRCGAFAPEPTVTLVKEDGTGYPIDTYASVEVAWESIEDRPLAPKQTR